MYGFQQFVASSGFMGIVFYQNSVIGELFWHFRIYGYDFRISPDLWVYF